MTCDCGALCSGVTRYDRVASRVRYVTVCDDCGVEQSQVGETVEYKPDFKPDVR